MLLMSIALVLLISDQLAIAKKPLVGKLRRPINFASMEEDYDTNESDERLDRRGKKIRGIYLSGPVTVLRPQWFGK